MSKREERIQAIAEKLLIAGRSPIDAFHAAQAYVNICEARDAVEAEAEATPEPEVERLFIESDKYGAYLRSNE